MGKKIKKIEVSVQQHDRLYEQIDNNFDECKKKCEELFYQKYGTWLSESILDFTEHLVEKNDAASLMCLAIILNDLIHDNIDHSIKIKVK
jgi:hypothetical protein